VVDFDIDSGMLSGCNPNNPLWKMQFSSSSYDAKSKWLNMYNTRLYIYDIPVFYTPYFGYSLDNRRQSGLLIPSLGISSDEGTYYQQPIYIALQNSWDLELRPQIRTNRGEGIYSNFRFVDSKISKGFLRLGYFKDKDSFVKRKKLANKEHLGFDFKYTNSSFINQWFGTSLDGQSELYVNIHYLNDIDYLNLSKNNPAKTVASRQVLSRVNLFYNTSDNYFGSYFKYYKDLTKENNDNTLQKLPTVHYHKYLDTFFKDHFLYNMDLKSTNIYRKKGVSTIQTDLQVPLTLQTALFDEYLNLSYEAFLYAQTSNFNGDNNISSLYNDGYYAREYNVVQASTRLTRAFQDLTHTVSFGAYYVFGGADSRSGYYKDVQDDCSINSSDPKCDFYSVSNVPEALNLEFQQYVFDSSGKRKLYHKLSQDVVYQGKTDSFGDLENEINYNPINAISLYNDMFFNYKERSFSMIYNSIKYSGYGVALNISYLYKDNFKKDQSGANRYTSYITSTISYNYDEHYSYKATYNYDLQINTPKTSQIGFLYKKRCWDFGLRYVENNRPILSNSGGSYNSIYERYLYFTILLKPIMKSNAGSNSAFTYKLPKLYKGS